MRGVQGDGGGYGLDTCGDAADEVGPGGGARGGHAGCYHGRWRHGRVNTGRDDAPGIVERPDASYAVGAVIQSWAERRGEGSHVFGGESGEGGAEGLFEDVQRMTNGEPFVESDGSGCFEFEILRWALHAERWVKYCIGGHSECG